MDHNFLGLIPPPNFVSDEAYQKYIDHTVDRCKKLRPSGFLVYDIQDEKGRNGEPRPFPYRPTKDPVAFALTLQEKTGLIATLYQTLTSDKPLQNLQEYIRALYERGIRRIAWVGGGASSPLEVPEALAITLKTGLPLELSCVAIAERHRDTGSEVDRLLSKVDNGVTQMTTQIIYNTDTIIMLIKDYCEECERRNIDPKRMVLCFAPFGKPETLKFLEWLGVEVPVGTARRILSRQDINARVNESVEVCLEIWNTVRKMCAKHRLRIELGVAVESVSKDAHECAAADELSGRLFRRLDSAR